MAYPDEVLVGRRLFKVSVIMGTRPRFAAEILGPIPSQQRIIVL